MTEGAVIRVAAQPAEQTLHLPATALLLIDMQRDFLEPGGFGEALGNDVSMLRDCIQPCVDLLTAARQASLLVIHTREGHRPDLTDVFPDKLARCKPGAAIGDQGPMGRILIRGEAGHDIIPELYPAADEIIIDKPGKGAFYATDLDLVLRKAGIRSLVVGGVTTEVCVHTTVREANDRGYQVLVAGDCCGSYFPEFQRVGLDMIAAQGGIFGAVTDSASLLTAMASS
ncbi:MAG: isochorismatase family cysteine hydrolase [Pseudomonadota bacterium]